MDIEVECAALLMKVEKNAKNLAENVK